LSVTAHTEVKYDLSAMEKAKFVDEESKIG